MTDTDPLREAQSSISELLEIVERVSDKRAYRAVKARARAALAAAPQPAHGTFDERKLHNLWSMGNCRMSFDAFKTRIIATQQPAEAAMQELADLGQAYDAQPAPDREALEDLLTELITEQSCGEWDDVTITKDVLTFTNALLARGLRLPGGETMAWAVVGNDDTPHPGLIYGSRSSAKVNAGPLGHIKRVAIRVVEGGDEPRP